MSIQERYASAVRSSCMTVDARTTRSDTDVLGAMGLAHRDLSEGRAWVNGRQVSITRSMLAVPLERLFMGDNTAAEEIVEIMAEWLRRKAPSMRLRLTPAQCKEIARACLAWHRDGVCKACDGHGTLLIPGSDTLGTARCKPCRGAGKVPLERQFRPEWRELVAWLVAEVEREQSKAGQAAMKQLASYLDIKQWVAEVGK